MSARDTRLKLPRIKISIEFYGLRRYYQNELSVMNMEA